MNGLPREILLKIFSSFSSSIAPQGSGYFFVGPALVLVNQQWRKVVMQHSDEKGKLNYLWKCDMNIKESQLGPFQLLAPLRRTGQVLQSRLGNRTIAIKALLPTDKLPTLLSNFNDLTAIHHPNLIFYYGVIVSDTQIYFLTEYCMNKSLKEIMTSKPKEKQFYDWHWYIRVALDVCHGLQALHRHNILHGSLQLKHVLITKNGTAKLTDVEFVFSVCSHQISLPDKGMFDYCSPEVCRQEKATASSDVYSLGILLWEMATFLKTGKHVRVYGDKRAAFQVMNEVGAGTLKPVIHSYFPNIIKNIVQSALAYLPTDRSSVNTIISNLLKFKEEAVKKNKQWAAVAADLII